MNTEKAKTEIEELRERMTALQFTTDGPSSVPTKDGRNSECFTKGRDREDWITAWFDAENGQVISVDRHVTIVNDSRWEKHYSCVSFEEQINLWLGFPER